MQLRRHPELHTVLWLWAMPDNTVIVRGQKNGEPWLRADPSYPPMTFTEGAFLHAGHPPESCHEIRFDMEFPGAEEKDDKGRPVLRGTVPVKVTIDPRDRAHALNVRHEVAVYVDLVFLFEEEQGTDPFTFIWDTSQLPPGEHLLTLNVIAYDDHIGIATRPVLIAAPQ
jgi:hypothetical protein